MPGIDGTSTESERPRKRLGRGPIAMLLDEERDGVSWQGIIKQTSQLTRAQEGCTDCFLKCPCGRSSSVSTTFKAGVATVMLVACPSIFHDRTEAKPDAVADGSADGTDFRTVALDLQVINTLGRRLQFDPSRHIVIVQTEQTGIWPVRRAVDMAGRLRQADSPTIAARPRRVEAAPRREANLEPRWVTTTEAIGRTGPALRCGAIRHGRSRRCAGPTIPITITQELGTCAMSWRAAISIGRTRALGRTRRVSRSSQSGIRRNVHQQVENPGANDVVQTGHLGRGSPAAESLHNFIVRVGEEVTQGRCSSGRNGRSLRHAKSEE